MEEIRSIMYLLIASTAIVTTILSVGVSWATVKVGQKRNEQEIGEIKDDVAKWPRKLYAEDGITVFVPRKECEREKADYRKDLTDRLTQLCAMVSDLNRQREQQQLQIVEGFAAVNSRIETLSSRLDQYIKDGADKGG